MKTWLRNNILFVAGLQALVATLGSLYFSEVMLLTPCILCWYQRIAMYPLIVLIFTGIFSKDTKVYRYILPTSLIGWGIALYHNLLYWNILPESAATCRAGISCTVRYIEWVGFITIPLMSLVAFSVIILCMLIYRKIIKEL